MGVLHAILSPRVELQQVAPLQLAMLITQTRIKDGESTPFPRISQSFSCAGLGLASGPQDLLSTAVGFLWEGR